MKSALQAGFVCAVALIGGDRVLAQCELSADPILSDTTRALFGIEIAQAGEWLVVAGSRTDPPPFYGSLNVYRRIAGDWVLDALIDLGAFANSGGFGNAVDAFGNRIIVSVRYSGTGPYVARIYRRDPSGWVLEQELSEAGATHFADAVAIGDDFAFASTRTVGNGAVAIFAYRRNGTTWFSEAGFICTGGDLSNGSFRPLAYDDGVLVVGDHANCNIEPAGALSADGPGRAHRISAPGPSVDSNEGAAAAVGCAGSWNYTKVFRRAGDGWVSEGTLPSDPLYCDGIEVAVDGDVIAMLGEHFQNTGYDVMIFEAGTLGGWDRVATLRPSLQQAGVTGLPLALDLSAGRIAVGFHGVNHPDNDTGAAFLINQVNGTWQETARFVANNAAADDEFGFGVAIAGGELFVGAPWREVDGVTNTGAVYTFDVSDCDGNGFPDECPGGCDDPQACADCNNNGTRDGCDRDCDSNGVPDDCECVQLPFFTDIAAPCCNNRFIEVVLPDSCQRSAARVKMVSLHHPQPPGPPPAADFAPFEYGPNCIEGPDGCVRWAGTPGVYVDSVRENTLLHGAVLSCAPQYHDWGGQMTIAMTGAEMIPSSVYEVQFIDEGCDPTVESNYTEPVAVETARWGDVAAPYQDPGAPLPNQPTAMDIAAVVDKVKDAPGAMLRVAAELSSQLITLSMATNAQDIGAAVDAVKGKGYPFAAPSVCP